MPSFAQYARYYDLLYREKDYAGEAAWVRGILEAHGARPGAQLLELGAGTGRHARALAAAGYRVDGLDRSEEMVGLARAELAAAPAEVRERVRLEPGDLRTVRRGERYDAVIALFHVMSYQTSQEDFEAGLATARAHLGPGGLFLFDAWYGPGVLSSPPEVRVKRVSDGGLSVLRIAEPTLHPVENRVDVAYTLFVREAGGAPAEVVEEVHRVRYWFHPEVEAAARRAGFAVRAHLEWMTGRRPDASTWNACWVLAAAP